MEKITSDSTYLLNYKTIVMDKPDLNSFIYSTPVNIEYTGKHTFQHKIDDFLSLSISYNDVSRTALNHLKSVREKLIEFYNPEDLSFRLQIDGVLKKCVMFQIA